MASADSVLRSQWTRSCDRLLRRLEGLTDAEFGPGVRNYADLAAPHGDAAGAIAYLARSQRLVTAALAEMDDGRLDDLRPTHFGAGWPARDVFVVLIDEQVHHGAEIALLRDLYRSSASTT